MLGRSRNESESFGDGDGDLYDGALIGALES